MLTYTGSKDNINYMSLTKTLNQLATAKQVMQKQAGNRMIVTFNILDDDGHTRMVRTSHYANTAEVLAEWDRYIERYGENNVSLFSEHSDKIALACKA